MIGLIVGESSLPNFIIGKLIKKNRADADNTQASN
jgi:hypothetical protein